MVLGPWVLLMLSLTTPGKAAGPVKLLVTGDSISYGTEVEGTGMNDGTKVRGDGFIMEPSGGTFQLQEGETV
jgi:hypothetical protein